VLVRLSGKPRDTPSSRLPKIEPLKGWTALDNPLATVRLTFATRSAAMQYVERHGFDYQIQDPPTQRGVGPRSLRNEKPGDPLLDHLWLHVMH
jgi:hypothetical protein